MKLKVKLCIASRWPLSIPKIVTFSNFKPQDNFGLPKNKWYCFQGNLWLFINLHELWLSCPLFDTNFFHFQEITQIFKWSGSPQSLFQRQCIKRCFANLHNMKKHMLFKTFQACLSVITASLLDFVKATILWKYLPKLSYGNDDDEYNDACFYWQYVIASKISR